MEIKIVRLNKINKEGSLRAFVDLNLNTITIKGFKVIQGTKGLFLSNPSEKGKDGKYYDTVLFDNLSDKQEVEARVLEEYGKDA